MAIKEILNKQTFGKIWKAGDCGGGKENTQKQERCTCVITRRSSGAYVLLGVCTSTAFYLG